MAPIRWSLWSTVPVNGLRVRDDPLACGPLTPAPTNGEHGSIQQRSPLALELRHPRRAVRKLTCHAPRPRLDFQRSALDAPPTARAGRICRNVGAHGSGASVFERSFAAAASVIIFERNAPFEHAPKDDRRSGGLRLVGATTARSRITRSCRLLRACAADHAWTDVAEGTLGGRALGAGCRAKRRTAPANASARARNIARGGAARSAQVARTEGT